MSACRDWLISWARTASTADAANVAEAFERFTHDLARTREGTARHLRRRLKRTRAPARRINACYDALLAWAKTAPKSDLLAASARLRRLTTSVARGR